MTDKEKLLEFLTKSDISKKNFYERTGFSQGFLNSGKSMGVDKLKIIIDAYPRFNYRSLLFDKKYYTLEESQDLINEDDPEYFNKKTLELLNKIIIDIDGLKKQQQVLGKSFSEIYSNQLDSLTRENLGILANEEE